MPLEEYKRKRKFQQTPEPEPGKSHKEKQKRGGMFCVQRHDASHLHYDLRLEVNGVLASWAVPKGPTLDPTRKSLAMKVEDHPIEYGGFEGNIPAGNYGAGSVMLWDTGTYELLDDPSAEEQLARGDFKFELHGSKLNGSFALVRMKKGQKGNEWLLIKKPDEYAVPGWDANQHAWSVLTKRTQEEIAANDSALLPSDLPGARKASFPSSIEPMLATLAEEPPSGDQWIYEVKWDGVRALCFIQHGKLRIDSRTGKRADQQYPELAHLPTFVDAKNAVLDGEIAVLDEQGRSRFELIQPRISTRGSAIEPLLKTNPARLLLFDLLYVDGYDLRGVPLEERKRVLESLVHWNDQIRFSQDFAVDPQSMLTAARKMGLEGIVAKDRRSTYESRRSRRWVKIKLQNQQEFVICGFIEGEREHFGALVLGVHEDGLLRHVGQVGTGFDGPLMKEIAGKMAPLVTEKCPLTPKLRLKDVTWVEPSLVCSVRFTEWTRDHMLRAPVFLGLREDKDANEVILEIPVPDPAERTVNGGLGTAKSASRKSKKTAVQKSELDLAGKKNASAQIDGHFLTFSNLDKIYYPKDGFTKRDVLLFYDRVAEWLVPHLKGRPLSLKRYPNGIHEKFFFQKNAGEHIPDWLHTEPIKESDPPKTNHYIVCDDRATLLYLVNLGCIDHNPWLSHIGSLNHPDFVLIDLDPFECPFDRIIEAALVVRKVLAKAGLKGYPKTTGGDGMHIYIPLDPVYTFEQVRSFAEILFHLAEQEAPNLFTEPRNVGRRKKDRVYFDWMQIGSGKTIAAPYVLRAHDGAPVATPLAWDELKPTLRPGDFNIKNAIERFERIGDIFRPVLEGGQRLEGPLRKLS